MATSVISSFRGIEVQVIFNQICHFPQRIFDLEIKKAEKKQTRYYISDEDFPYVRYSEVRPEVIGLLKMDFSDILKSHLRKIIAAQEKKKSAKLITSPQDDCSNSEGIR